MSDHTIMNLLSGKFNCLHCGTIEKYNELLPLPLDTALAIAKSYGKAHKRCKKSEAGEKLSKLNAEAWAKHEAEKKT